MIHIKRNICLVAVSCTLLAGIPLQGVAQTGRTAKVQATQNHKITVSGTVLDKTTNDPLIGVSVVVKGVANAGTITDMDGKFTLKLPYAEAPLVFSYLGYQPQEIVPGAKKELTVLLQEDTKALQEVVVVGYTKQRKETMIGSVATITTKDLTQSPTANINNALAGRLPGLIVNQYAGGEPGVDQSELFIRGKATYGNQSAIVIVDGIERDMSYLAPDEIETFTILKDASATAAYGIRGANGVIVITTKRGKAAEKATVNLKASIGINQPIGFPEYLGSADYATLYNEARLNDAKMTGADISSLNLFSQQAIDNFRRAKGDNSDGLGYDWDYYDFAFKPGLQEDVSLSIRGGTDKVRYYVLANYFSQGGNYKYSNAGEYDSQTKFTRYNFRSNIDININRYLSTRLDLGARITDRNAPGTTAGRLMTICATQPPYLPILVEENAHPQNEEYIQQNPRGMLYGDNIYRYNLLGELSRTGYLNEKNTYLNGSFAMNLDMEFLTKGLKAEVMFSYDASEGRWINRKLDTYKDGYREYPKYATFMPIEGSDAYMAGGHYTGAYKTGNKYDIDQTIGNGFSHNASDGRTYIQARLDYNRLFSNRHEVTAMLLANRGNRTVNNELAYHSQGITGRFAYYYNQKYLMEFNFGYNGSENFAAGHRVGFFPAVAVGWYISNEKFFSPLTDVVSKLKLKASVGQVGNDQIGGDVRFIYLGTVSTTNDYVYGNYSKTSGERVNEVANPNVGWEVSTKQNYGFELGLFNKLEIQGDWYHDVRDHIFVRNNNIPAYVGMTTVPMVNVGKMKSWGFDGSLEYRDRIGQVNITGRGTFTYANNEILRNGDALNKYPWMNSVGQKIYQKFGWEAVGLFESQEEIDRSPIQFSEGNHSRLRPGDIKYRDLNGDGVIDDYDKMPIGFCDIPEITYGFGGAIEWKGFDVSIFFQGTARVSLFEEGSTIVPFSSGYKNNDGFLRGVMENRWTVDNPDPNARYPRTIRPSDALDNNNTKKSSFWVRNAAFLRLKNAEIGYTFPKRWMEKMAIQNLRLYVSGVNLLTWAPDVHLFDPDLGSGDGRKYPPTRVFNVGLNINF